MPIYEYKCKECGHKFEVLILCNEDPKLRCENCRSLNLEKIISHTNFKLNGNGWSKDGYTKM